MDPKEIEGARTTRIACRPARSRRCRETYKFLNAAYPIMNEHQLAIGETTFGGKRELKSDVGIIDCPELYRLVLERAKTAREAIQIADELTKQYGYNDYGEAFTFADKDEVWFFEILGPGRGKKGAVWAAVRIPDDEVAVSANAPRIRKLDLKDPDQLHGVGQRATRWPRNSAGGARRAASRSSSARPTARAAAWAAGAASGARSAAWRRRCASTRTPSTTRCR